MQGARYGVPERETESQPNGRDTVKTDLLSTDKVIVTVAITGGLHGKEANANLPITAEEQAQAAYDAYNAGASIVHLHVRDEQGYNTPSLDFYEKTVRLIGDRCPLIRQIGNGIGARPNPRNGRFESATLEERMNLLDIDPRPEMMTVNGGTFEFRSPVGAVLFDNNLDFNTRFITGCRSKGYGIELEVYDPSHVANMVELKNRGVIEGDMHFSIVLGIKGGSPATANNLMHMVNELPEGSSWQVVTVGRYHFRSNAIALAMGGNVRTGMEDTVFLDKGIPVKSNAQLVERTVALVRAMGREPATVEEARRALGIGR